MQFAAGVNVVRLRAAETVDPYSLKTRETDWSAPSSLVIENAFVAASSSVAGADPIRAQVTTTKSLYCPPDADVRAGDRVVSGGVTYSVPAKPEADTNPFTGWQPIAEIPLREVSG